MPFAIISNWYVYKIVLRFTIFNIFTHHEHPLGNKGWYVDHKANKYHKISINRCSKTIYIAGGIFHLCPTYFTHMYYIIGLVVQLYFKSNFWTAQVYMYISNSIFLNCIRQVGNLETRVFGFLFRYYLYNMISQNDFRF